MKRRLLALLLTFVMLVSAMPMSVFAGGETPEETTYVAKAGDDKYVLTIKATAAGSDAEIEALGLTGKDFTSDMAKFKQFADTNEVGGYHQYQYKRGGTDSGAFGIELYGNVKLTGDTVLPTNAGWSSSMRIYITRDTVIDLNGYTLKQTAGTGQSGYAMFVVDDNVTLTIKDSSTDGTGRISAALYAIQTWPNENAKVIVEGGTIAADAPINPTYDTASVSSVLYCTTGEVKFTGGKIEAPKNRVDTNGNQVTVAGNELVGNGGDTDKCGGTVTFDAASTLGEGTINTANISTVSGAETAKVAEGFVCVKNTDGTFTIGTAVAKISNVKYTSLNDAILEAKTGEIVEIIQDCEYKMPEEISKITTNITIKAADGVNAVFDCTGSGNVCAIPNGVTIENVTMNFGKNSYHGAQHAGTINIVDCTLNGLFYSYSDMNFTGCTFNAPGTTESGISGTDYSMWLYAGNVSFENCTFNGAGKFFNVYNEGNARKDEDGKLIPWEVSVKNCVAISSTSNKAVFNVKETCTNGENLTYDVDFDGTNVAVGAFPASSTSDALSVLNAFVQVDDKRQGGTDDGGNITIESGENAKLAVLTTKEYNEVKDNPTQLDTKITEKATAMNASYETPAKQSYVAKIGDQGYATLQAAINAAKDGDVIVMLADTAPAQAEFKSSGNTVTLDLNGHTISGVAYNAGNGSYTVANPIKVSGGTLIIDDTKGGGKIVAKEDTTYGGNYCLYLFGGNAVIKNGTFESSKCVVLELGNSVLTIDGGKFIANGTDTQYVQAINNSSASLVINGGEFESNGKTLFAQNDKAEVNGGYFKGTVDCKTYKPLKGGYYDTDPTAYVAEGYELVTLSAESTDDDKAAFEAGYLYKVVETPAANVAKIGTTEYKTLAEAIAACTDGVETEIDIIADIVYDTFDQGSYKNASVVIPSNKNIVLDLNGHTISAVSDVNGATEIIYNMGTLTITDSGENGTITYKSNHPDGSYGYGTNTILNRGILTVAGGTIENTTTGGASYAVDSQTYWFDDIIPIEFYLTGGNVVCTTGDAAIRQAATLGEKYTKNGQIVKNNMTISGGKVTGDIWVQSLATDGIGSYSTLTITGGEITGKVYDTLNGDGSHLVYDIKGGRIGQIGRDNGTMSKDGFVSGGYFTKEVPAARLADGYECVLIEEMANPTDTDNAAKDAGYIYTIGKAAAESDVVVEEVSDDKKTEIAAEAAEDVKEDKKDIVKEAAETAVEQLVGNTEVTKVETKIEEAVKTDEETVSKIIERANDQAKENIFDENSTTDTKIEVKLETIKVDTAKVVEDTQATDITVNTAVYDVKPIATVTTTITTEQGTETKTETVELTNKDLNGKPVTVRLAVPSTEATMAKVTHKSEGYDDEIFYATVQGTTPNQFVEIQMTHFSTVEVEVLEELSTEHVAAVISADGKTATGYETLQAAFDAATDGQTIVMLADTAPTQAEFKSSGNTVTLDLNGHTISGVAYNAGNGSYTVGNPIKVSAGTLIIDDTKGGGKIVAKEDTTYGGNYCLYLYGGNAVINNGTLESSKCAVLELGNSLLTVNGGKIISNGTDTQYVQAINNMSASLVINGGEFESNGKALFAQNDKAEVKGGYFKGTVDCKTYKPLKGGYYTMDVSAYVAEGYAVVTLSAESTGDDKAAFEAGYSHKVAANVAQIIDTDGETVVAEYTSLQAAFDAATEGQTIVMLADTAGVPATTSNNWISVNLDLNGHTISGAEYDAGGNLVTACTPITVGMVYLNIKDTKGGGKIVAKDDDKANPNYCLKVSGGDVTIYGGVFEGDSRAVYEGGGNLIIEGGKFTASEYAIFDEVASFTINGGEFEGNLHVGDDTSKVNGGYFKGSVERESTQFLPLQGGCYKNDPSGYVGNNYEVVVNTDAATKAEYPYKVVQKGKAVAQIVETDMKYASLQEAFDAAEAGQTVKVIADIDYGPDVKFGAEVKTGKNIILDLNGHTVEATRVAESSTTIIKNNGKLKVIDSGETNNKGKLIMHSTVDANPFTVTCNAIFNYGDVIIDGAHIESSEAKASYAIDTVKGSMTVNSGKIVGSYCAFRAYSQQGEVTFTINGGEFIGNHAMFIQNDGETHKLTGTINGGEFKGNKTAGYIWTKTGSSEKTCITVMGGKFKGGDYDVNSDGNPADTLFFANVGTVVLKNGYFTLNTYYDKTTGGYVSLNGLVADDYKCIDTPEDDENHEAYPYMIGVKAVAMIGGVTYPTLAAAVAAVPTDGTETTITMIDNEAIDVAGKAGITIARTQNIVLDLNGFTVAGICTTGKGSELIFNEGILTIKDSSDTDANGTGNGKLTYGANPTWDYDGTVAGSYSSNLITNRNTLTIESGYYLNDATGSACYVVDNYGNGYDTYFTLNGGKLVNKNYCAVRFTPYTNATCVARMNGGIIESLYSCVINYQNIAAPKADIKFCGTIVNGSSTSLYESSGSGNNINDWSNFTLSVESGKFSGSDGEFVWMNKAEHFVSGGYFKNVIDAKYIAPGYVCIDNPDYNSESEDITSIAYYPYMIGLAPVAPSVDEKAKESSTADLPEEFQDNADEAKSMIKEIVIDEIKNNVVVSEDGASNIQSDDVELKLASVINNATHEDGSLEKMIDSTSQLKITVKSVVASTTETTIGTISAETVTTTTASYDVKPWVTIEKTEGGTTTTKTRKITNTELEKAHLSDPNFAITFRLAVPASMRANYVEVIHYEEDGSQGTNLGTFVVEEEHGNRYVVLSAWQFSVYEIVTTETDTFVAVNRNTRKAYKTVYEALNAAEAGQTVYLVADATSEKETSNGVVEDLDGSQYHIIKKDVTLDLNGYDLESAGVIVFGGVLMDDSEEHDSKLFVENKYGLTYSNSTNSVFVLNSETVDKYVFPVRDETDKCFTFVHVRGIWQDWTKASGTGYPKYRFAPEADPNYTTGDDDEIKQILNTEGVEVRVEASYNGITCEYVMGNDKVELLAQKPASSCLFISFKTKGVDITARTIIVSTVCNFRITGPSIRSSNYITN